MVNSKINKGNWGAWDRLVKRYTLAAVVAAADALPALDRWPDQTEAVLEELSRKQPRRSTAPVLPAIVGEAMRIIDRVGWEAAKAHMDCRNVITSEGDLRDYLTIDPPPHELAQQLVDGAKAAAGVTT